MKKGTTPYKRTPQTRMLKQSARLASTKNLTASRHRVPRLLCEGGKTGNYPASADEGNEPSCCSRPKASVFCQSFVLLPSVRCAIAVVVMLIDLPVGAPPRHLPLWVARNGYRYATLSSSASMSSSEKRRSGNAVHIPANHCLNRDGSLSSRDDVSLHFSAPNCSHVVAEVHANYYGVHSLNCWQSSFLHGHR